MKNRAPTAADMKMVDQIIRDYSRTWTLLHQYDEGTLEIYRGSSHASTKKPTRKSNTDKGMSS